MHGHKQANPQFRLRHRPEPIPLPETFSDAFRDTARIVGKSFLTGLQYVREILQQLHSERTAAASAPLGELATQYLAPMALPAEETTV